MRRYKLCALLFLAFYLLGGIIARLVPVRPEWLEYAVVYATFSPVLAGTYLAARDEKLRPIIRLLCGCFCAVILFNFILIPFL